MESGIVILDGGVGGGAGRLRVQGLPQASFSARHLSTTHVANIRSFSGLQGVQVHCVAPRGRCSVIGMCLKGEKQTMQNSKKENAW